jgi:hypothetical protein
MVRVSVAATMSENAHLPELPTHGLTSLDSTKRVATAAVTRGFVTVGVVHPTFD